MRRSALWWSFVALSLATPAFAATSASINITLGNAPPPPVVVYRQEPEVVLVPSSRVYVVDSDSPYDEFRYGVYWYVYNGGYWYRARTWRGPFIAIRPAYVPRAVITVPANRWKHHPHGMPPGQAKKYRRDDVVVVREKHRGHGH